MKPDSLSSADHTNGIISLVVGALVVALVLIAVFTG